MTSTISTLPDYDAPQVAVNDIGSEEDFLAAIDETIKYFNDGDIVEGTIVKVDRDEVLLDIGYKTEGVIPSRELSIKHDVDPSEVVTVGDKVEALVLQKEDKEGRLILSKKRAQYERAWGTIEQVKEEDGVVDGTVIEVVKGGLILDIGLRGFLPASLVEMRRVRDLQPYVGQTLEAKIIELDKNRNNVVLSRRAWLEQTQSEVRHGFLTQLQKGQIRKGVVSSIVNFGAFVDLGGVDGLVHVSELSWKHIDHPSEVVAVGDEVTVEVLDVDMDRERVSLSLKATQEDPWQHFARTHQIGQIVPGKVTKLVPFGSFVRVEEGIEGLVHISELAERHVEIPEQVVQVNDDVMVKIIDIDLERRRISLSLKQANETATAAEVEEFDPTLYGMTATYDEQGNYVYPEGFDPETGEWLEGFDEQRAVWEEQYAKAHARWEAHVKQQAEAAKAEVEAGEATSYSSGAGAEEAATSGGGDGDDRHRRLAGLRRGAAGAPREAHRRRELTTRLTRTTRPAPKLSGPGQSDLRGWVRGGQPSGVGATKSGSSKWDRGGRGEAATVVGDDADRGGGDREDRGGHEGQKDECRHGSNHAPGEILPRVAGMPLYVDFLPLLGAGCLACSKVAVLVQDGVEPFGLGAMCEVWAEPYHPEDDNPVFDFVVATPHPGRVRGPSGFDLHVEHGLDAAADADLVCIAPQARRSASRRPRWLEVRAGGARPRRLRLRALHRRLRARRGGPARRPPLHHPLAARRRAGRAAYPQALVDPNVLYVQDGTIVTGAGSAAGLDASLHLMRQQFGAKVAADAGPPDGGPAAPRRVARRSTSPARSPTATPRRSARC